MPSVIKIRLFTGSQELVAASDDWTQAIRQFWDLRDQEQVPREQWQLIVDWLTNTTFDNEKYMARAVGYALARERAPAEIQHRLLVEKGPPPKCRLSIFRVASVGS